MKCKQCGWENPDNIERCVKCNNFLTKPRFADSPMTGYETERTVIDYTAGVYGPGQNMDAPQNNAPGAGMPPYGGAYGYPEPRRESAPQARPAADGGERYCPECDAELPAGATECPVCHTRIETETIAVVENVCPECGSQVAPGQNFCANCGTRLNTRPQPAPVQPQPGFVADEPAVAPQAPWQQEPGFVADEPAVAPETPWQPETCPAGGGSKLNLEKPADAGTPEPAPAKLEEATECMSWLDEEDDTVPGGPLAEKVPECELRMSVAGAEEGEGRTVACAGTEVDLYRSNTDPANNTIARDVQARLTYADGKWSIEDRSALGTTYVRAVRKIELRDGDVIVMGNREFIFKS